MAVQFRTDEIKRKYDAVDKLVATLKDGQPYTVHSLTDEVMGISTLDNVDTRYERRKFLDALALVNSIFVCGDSVLVVPL